MKTARLCGAWAVWLAATPWLFGCSTDAVDGVSCWDSNSNGECDGSEDVNGDGDCNVLADKLDALLKSNKDALAALAESDANQAARKRSAKYQGRIDKAFTKIVSKSKKCGAEPRVAASLARIL